MSASVNEDVSSPLSDAQSVLDPTISKSSSHDSLDNSAKISPIEAGQSDGIATTSEPTTPKPNPMAFTIDFGDARKFDRSKLEELAKKSQARHQRVQSMSASLTKPSPVTQKPPMSAKLPRKAQGYNSEGYFSSDQEDSCLSGSIKLRQSPLTQNSDRTHITSPITNRNLKSPINDSFTLKRMSKSPIVDSIMSRSDILPSRQSLNLPLKNPNSSFMRDVHRTPSYGNLSSSYQLRSTMADIIDQSPEAVMLTDISSPELDILTPDNGLSTPDGPNSPRFMKGRRAVSETPDLLFKKCPLNSEPLYIDDDIDRQSNNSSTGTYTIEADTYTEEQKARMSIDRSFGTEVLSKTIDDTLKARGASSERDPELIYDHARFIHEVPTRDTTQRTPLVQSNTFDYPMRQSNDKNVLEISCCYDSPTEHDLAAQTSKQIKSTRSYLEKIKNRVRTITEKSFPKPPKDEDVGNFTSVTTSGVLSTKSPLKVIEYHKRRRCSLTKSDIDQTDYVHRLSRESSVPVSLPSNKLPLEENRFESTALWNAHKSLRDDSGVASDITPEQVVGKLSYLSLNRCKGDKTWIQEWAESVKKYNNHTLAEQEKGLNDTFTLDDERPPMSPRRETVSKYAPPRNVYSSSGTPTKIPSPVSSMHHRLTPDLIPSTHDTEAYLQKTQNAITNLQAKLHTRTNHATNIPPALTASVLSEKTASSRLPVSTLSRSNSLNYRLRSKPTSGDNSPLRSPGNYVITGSGKAPEGRLLVNNVSRSLEADRRRDSNMNSPISDRGLHSNSSDDKTLSNKHSDTSKSHVRHRSFDGRTNDFDLNNANSTVCLKTVLKNNAEAQNLYPRIEQTRCLGDGKRGHQRVYSDGLDKPLKTLYGPNNIAFGSSIKRSSSFSTVTKNNNYMDANQRISNCRRSSGHSEFNVEKDVVDYLSDESERSFEKSQESRYKRPVARTRIESPDLKSIAPANSPRLCPNTPEMQRKFGPGLVRNSVRVTHKERGLNSRLSEPPIAREERAKPANHQSRRISEPTRQAVLNRLTKSRSSTREFEPKSQMKGTKKPSQHRSSSALASKELEFTNWKKRASYDPMKAAQEDRKRRQQMASAKRLEGNKDDLSSPSHSSPVHRSQSFHTTNIADLEALDYSSEGTEEDQMQILPMDNPMITSTHSDILDLRRTEPRDVRRQAMNNDVVLTRDYVTGFQVNQPANKPKRRLADAEKRKTYLVDDITPTRENVDFLKADTAIDKRKTFILDSDTNSTTNGSSPRTSSIFSHEKNSLTTGTSDTEGESGTESAPVVLRHPGGKRTTKEVVNPKHRYSGDYSMSSSTTSIANKKPIQPRYLDISKYKNENSAKNFLRRDPSKTYVGVLNHGERAGSVSKGSAQHYEMEQKKQELEKWKRRASYDPRKSAAQARGKPAPKTASSVLRSQSFHGPVLVSTPLRYQPPTFIAESYDASSDNDF